MTSQAPTADTDLSTLRLTDVIDSMPEGNWTIIGSHTAWIKMADGRRGEVYWDDLDSESVGWAYRIGARGSKPEESGPLNDAEDVRNAFIVGGAR